jgi:nucleotide-binding universal stress UspA family protein
MIICGSDLSEPSADALEVARLLARQRGDDELVLVHVLDEEAAGSPGPEREARVDAARLTLDALAAAHAAAPRLRIELVVGPPDEALLSLAETEGADLIVIASRSRGGSLLNLGTTAQRVVARAAMPVLVVRDPAPWREFGQGDRRLRVLLAMDDSPTSDLGAQWTLGLRAQGPVDVTLGAIYYTDEAAAHFGLPPRALVDRDPEIERLMARDLLRRFGATAGDGRGAVVARPRRGLGRLGDHVLELATEEAADLIVVGTSQQTGLGRLGSVSTVVIHDAPQSVLCVPPSSPRALATVPTLRSALVATDLSPFASRAVPYAFALTPPGGQVHLVHVSRELGERGGDGDGSGDGAATAGVGADEDPAIAELRAALLAQVPTGAPQQVIAHVVHGDDPAQAIAQAAARLGVDVICIASRGRSGISRAIVGSVADKLLRETRVPVLVLRPRE